MKASIFIFHGTAGHPGENWFPWARHEFEARGYEVIIPQFPTPEGQSLAAWRTVLETHLSKITEASMLIGHSLGGLFLLRVLETLAHPVAASVFVGAPVGVRPIKNYDADSAFAAGFDFDWPSIRTHAGRATVFHSDNDPYVSLGNGQELARQLGVELTMVPGAGHFNASAGYTEFPQLVEAVDKNNQT